MKKINVFFIYLISFIFMEFLFKFLLYDHIFRLSNINLILFLIPFSLILSIITNLSKSSKANYIIMLVILGLMAVWFSAEYVVRDYFGCYVSWSSLSLAGQVGEFASKGVVETLRRIPGIIGLFIPFILTIIFHKKLNFHQFKWQKTVIILVITILSYGIYLLGLNIGKNESYSPYVLYHNINDVNLNMENFGVINSFLIDTKRVILGFEQRIDTDIDNPLNDDSDKSDTPKEYSYNVLNINFDNLIQNESNNTIKNMHEYFKNDLGTKQNEYTGIFKDKNLILFMAESFNEIAVSPELTPTLYKLTTSGFVFDNFYSPTILSTIGGEFQELTGLFPADGVLSKWKSGKNSFPQGIATIFQKENYQTYAYHDNSYTFQQRNYYLPSIGFNNFKACNNGLEKLINCNAWPESDIEMINATVDDYINDDKFMAFYATVSGHNPYDSLDTNQMAKKHKDEYLAFNLPYSKRVAAYLAAQMELDQALKLLIEKLDAAGKLENTVIALVGDHYPYELTTAEVNEASSYKKDGVVEINHSNFIFWNSEMDTVKISKVGSQIDVIPTIYNAFGIPYDSRLFIGKDILSTEGGLAIFGNKSWVTDKGTYFASSSKFVPKNGVTVDDDYVKQMIKVVDNKVEMSRKIIVNNYYSKLGL